MTLTLSKLKISLTAVTLFVGLFGSASATTYYFSDDLAYYGYGGDSGTCSGSFSVNNVSYPPNTSIPVSGDISTNGSVQQCDLEFSPIVSAALGTTKYFNSTFPGSGTVGANSWYYNISFTGPNSGGFFGGYINYMVANPPTPTVSISFQ